MNKFIIIGLGNPGEKYKQTRHNVGKMLARWLKAEGRRPKDEGSRMSEGFEIVETECFMNSSGIWINKHYKNYKDYKNLFIVHDDLDIPLGKFKIQFGKGPRLHKGILSIEQALGTKEFWRVRIGIEGRRTKDEGRRTSGEDYVLERFTAAEKKILETVFLDVRDRLLRDFKGT